MQPPVLTMNMSPQQLQDFLEQLVQVLSGNVSFGTTLGKTNDQNILCSKASGAAPGVANTEFTVAHTLGRVPLGYIVISQDAAASFYKSTTAWTSSNIYLKCSVPSVNYVLIVI